MAITLNPAIIAAARSQSPLTFNVGPTSIQAQPLLPSVAQASVAASTSSSTPCPFGMSTRSGQCMPAPMLTMTPQVGPSYTAPSQQTTQQMPASIRVARYNTTSHTWTVYAPSGGTMAGLSVSTLGGACLSGDCGGLGVAVTPPPPAGYQQVQTGLAAKPADAVDGGTESSPPWYANWKLWAGIGGGLALLGGGYYVMRRR